MECVPGRFDTSIINWKYNYIKGFFRGNGTKIAV